MNRKTISIEAQRLFRKNKHGMDVVALELLNRLRKENTPFEMEVLVKEDMDHCLQDGASFRVRIMDAAFYPLWEQWILPRFVRNHSSSLLHCTGNTAPIFCKTPLLITIHDLIFLEENYLFKKDGGSLYQRFGNFYRSIVVPIVARKAKYLITVSEFQRQLIIQRLKISPEKISVVYNGADERFFQIASENLIQQTLAKYGIGQGPYIFFLANTEPRKNTDNVLKAFAILCQQNPSCNLRLVIKGLAEEQLAKKVSACGANTVADRIIRVGYIDYEDLPLLYQGASLLWFPSFSEGFGLPIVEAMAGGTPVITSSVSVMPEIAGDAALYVDPHQPQELVNQTMLLMENKELREELSKKGKENAGRFTWAASVKVLLDIYQKLIS